jgi:hypothetical protein
MISEGRVGFFYVQDGVVREYRFTRDSSLVVSDGAARYQELVFRGNNQGVFALSTTTSGVTLAAANASLVAATFQPIVGFFNPAASGKICSILQVSYGVQATGAAAVNEGIPIYQVTGQGASTTITGTNPLNLKTMLTGGSVCIGSVNQAFTGNASTFIQLKPFTGLGGGPRVTAPTASINTNTLAIDNVDGLIQIPPGFAFGLGVLASGTTITVASSIIWTEISA